MAEENKTPSEHFAACGPFCKHVVFCYACIETCGLCPKHRDDPNGSVSWAEDSKEDP